MLHTDDEYGDEADDCDDHISRQRRLADKYAVKDEVSQTQLDSVIVLYQPTPTSSLLLPGSSL